MEEIQTEPSKTEVVQPVQKKVIRDVYSGPSRPMQQDDNNDLTN